MKTKIQGKKKKNERIVNEVEKSLVNTLDNDVNVDKDDAWLLHHVLSFDEVSSEYKVMCASESCKSQDLFIYVGNKTYVEWAACIDFMLRDYDDWPTEELCTEVNASLPIDANLELYTRENVPMISKFNYQITCQEILFCMISLMIMLHLTSTNLLSTFHLLLILQCCKKKMMKAMLHVLLVI